MGIVVRQSIISSIISYLGVVVGYLNLFYLYPKYLSPDQVGLFRTIQDAAILFSPFAQIGLTQSIYRFYPQFVKDQTTSHTFMTMMIFFGLAGFGLFFIAFKIFETPLLGYFQDNAKEIIDYSFLVIWLTLILVLLAAFETFSRSLLKTIVPNFIREVVSRLLLSVLVAFYFMGWLSFDQFMIGSVVIYLICLTIVMIYLWSDGSFKINTNFQTLKTEKLPELVRYSLLSFAGMAGMILIGKMDSLMVSSMIGLAANAVYTTAFFMATVIEIPKRSLSQIAMPLISRAFEKNDLKDIQKIYHRTAINQLIIGLLILIGLYANIDSIFSLMPKREVYEAGKWVVVIVGIGKLADMAFGPSSEIIVLSKHYQFNIILILLLAISIIISNNLLIPAYGIEGAAYGTALALIMFNAIKYLYLKWRLQMQPFGADTLKVLAIALLTLGVNHLLPHLGNVFADIAVRSLLITLVFSSLVLWTNVSEEATKIFQTALAYIQKRKK